MNNNQDLLRESSASSGILECQQRLVGLQLELEESLSSLQCDLWNERLRQPTVNLQEWEKTCQIQQQDLEQKLRSVKKQQKQHLRGPHFKLSLPQLSLFG